MKISVNQLRSIINEVVTSGSKHRHYNPERKAFAGKSYRNGGKRVTDLREASQLSSDSRQRDLEPVTFDQIVHDFDQIKNGFEDADHSLATKLEEKLRSIPAEEDLIEDAINAFAHWWELMGDDPHQSDDYEDDEGETEEMVVAENLFFEAVEELFPSNYPDLSIVMYTMTV